MSIIMQNVGFGYANLAEYYAIPARAVAAAVSLRFGVFIDIRQG